LEKEWEKHDFLHETFPKWVRSLIIAGLEKKRTQNKRFWCKKPLKCENNGCNNAVWVKNPDKLLDNDKREKLICERCKKQ
jgi:hypothetical protein